MQNNPPLNKVVFIQKVAAFTKTDSLKDLFQLAYVNNSWNDTMKNYSFHLFEAGARATKDIHMLAIGTTYNTLERFCARVFECGVLWFVKVLMFSQNVMDRINLLGIVWQNVSSLDITRLVFSKIVEVGGKDLLESKLTATDKNGWSCLMFGCNNPSSSPKIMTFVFEKIIEVGGTGLLKSQLTAKTTDKGRSCLMLCCYNSNSLEIMKLLFEKIIEVGGKDLLESQLAATDKDGETCLMLACRNSSSPEVINLLFANIGGPELIQSQLAVRDKYGSTCLMVACEHSSPTVVKLLFEKIDEVGGKEFLKIQLNAATITGTTCLMIACRDSSSSEVPRLIFEKIIEAGGSVLLKSSLADTSLHGSTCLTLSCCSSLPPEVLKLLAVLLFQFGLLTEQFELLDECDKKSLKEKTGIDSPSSWSPDTESLTEVKLLLGGGDSRRE